MPTPILITGGLGYIGSHCAKLFLKKGYKVIIFDNVSRGFLDVLDVLNKYGEVKFFRGDLRQEKDVVKLFEVHQIEGILHFAAHCSVNESMEDPGLYFQNNVSGSLNLIKNAEENGIDKFIFSSTCATYGESEHLPIDEKHPQRPTNPYGESKLMVEKILRWFGELRKFNYVILRYFNVCGADSDGELGDSKKPSVHLMQNAVRGAMGIEPFNFTYSKVNTPDGSTIRDYLDVEDLSEAHFSAYEYLRKGGASNVFNLGTGKGNSVKEIIQKVEEILGVEIDKSAGESRKGEYTKLYADPKKVKNILGWEPKKTLEDSVRSLHKWYKRYPAGFEKQ